MTPDSDPVTGPFTSTTLLERLRDPDDHTVWRDYVERYRPLVVRYVAKLGLGAEDAEDVAQSTLLAFSTAYREGRYDRDRGRLSSWLFGIATNQLRNFCRGRRPAEGAERLAEVADDSELEEVWDRQWRDAVVGECLRIVRTEVQPGTMRAFELFALEERPASDVAAELGISENAVFGAKRRVLQRVRDLLPLVEDVF